MGGRHVDRDGPDQPITPENAAAQVS